MTPETMGSMATALNNHLSDNSASAADNPNISSSSRNRNKLVYSDSKGGEGVSDTADNNPDNNPDRPTDNPDSQSEAGEYYKKNLKN